MGTEVGQLGGYGVQGEIFGVDGTHSVCEQGELLS
jgi:hypothetical protein